MCDGNSAETVQITSFDLNFSSLIYLVVVFTVVFYLLNVKENASEVMKFMNSPFCKHKLISTFHRFFPEILLTKFLAFALSIRMHHCHPDALNKIVELDDKLTQSSVPQSMFSLFAKLSPEYKELLQSYPSSSKDVAGKYNPAGIKPNALRC